MIQVDENHLVYKLYCERLGDHNPILKEAQDEDGHRMYKITVNKFYLFDTIESKPSQKYELDWK